MKPGAALAWGRWGTTVLEMWTAEHEQCGQEEDMLELTGGPVTRSLASTSSRGEDQDEKINHDLWHARRPKVLLPHARVGNSPLSEL